ncbi:MAG: hypothetical protein KA312_10810 [Sphingorhabdus sp.]|nr:hypothetical protein [Sphingorhabdus sp.]
MRLILAFALSISPLAVSAPAAAQQRMLTIFGDDKCPSDTICVVAPETERYRIPRELRESLKDEEAKGDRESWAVRSQATLNVANKAPNSCSEPTVGAGGWTGCFMKQLKESYAEKTPEPEVP